MLQKQFLVFVSRIGYLNTLLTQFVVCFIDMSNIDSNFN